MIRMWSHGGVRVYITMSPVELQQTTIAAVGHPHKESLCVGAEGYTSNLPKKVDLLGFAVIRLHIIHMNKVCRLCHRHEPPIGGELDGSNSSHPPLENSHGL